MQTQYKLQPKYWATEVTLGGLQYSPSELDICENSFEFEDGWEPSFQYKPADQYLPNWPKSTSPSQHLVVADTRGRTTGLVDISSSDIVREQYWTKWNFAEIAIVLTLNIKFFNAVIRGVYTHNMKKTDMHQHIMQAQHTGKTNDYTYMCQF